MRKLGRIGIALFFATVASRYHSVAGDSEKPESRLLEQCLRTYQQMDSMECHVTSEIRISTPIKTDSATHMREKIVMRLKDEEFCLRSEHRVLDKQVDQVHHNQVIVNKHGFYRTSYVSPKEEKPKSGMVSINNKEKWWIETIENLSFGTYLDGYMVGLQGKRVAEAMLSEGNAKGRGKEKVGSIECDVICSKGKYGEITMWLDQDQGCLPVRVRIEKSGDNLYKNGKTLEEQQTMRIGKEQLKCIRVFELLDHLQIVKIGDQFATTAGLCVLTHHFQDGRNRSYSVNCERTIDLNPQFKSGTDCGIDVPENAPINNLDDRSSGVVYVWQQGKVIPISPAVTGTTEGVWRTPSRNKYLKVILSILTIGLIIVWLFKRALDARRKT